MSRLKIKLVCLLSLISICCYSQVQVRNEKVEHVEGPQMYKYGVVAGSFGLKSTAASLKARLENKGYEATIVKNVSRNMYRVVATSSNDLNTVGQLRDNLRKDFPDAWVLMAEGYNYKSGGGVSGGGDKQLAQTDVPRALPNLEIVANSMAFIDESGINAIQANNTYKIRFQLRNTGKGAANQCKVRISANGSTKGIKTSDVSLKTLNAGDKMTVDVPISSGINTVDGQVEFAIQVDEPNGFGTDPQYIKVNTKAFVEPYLKITDYSLTSEGGQSLKKKQPFDLQLMLQNTKYGQADDVQISVDVPQNVMIIEGNRSKTFAQLKAGETKSLVYSLIVNNNYTETTIPVVVHLKEKYGKYAEDRTINLTLDQTFASTKIAVNEVKQQQHQEISIASIGSDVDKDIPSVSGQQDHTFAVIITNEHYTMVEPVPFAKNDGDIFSIYCNQTLGIPQHNIRVYQDATYGKLLTAIKDIKNIANAYKGDINVVFYYAGHGVPDEQSRDAYLLPIDSDGKMIETCYSLNKLYKELGSLNANNVVVFMDACFSGTRRGEGMLASARGVAIKAKDHAPQGNMVVFSAASGDETAYPFKEQSHGLFTYFLLKKLKESKGTCSLGELGTYIQEKVKQSSIVFNRKSQTPTVTSSTSMAEIWRDMKLR